MAFSHYRFQKRKLNRERRTQIFWVDPDCLLYYLTSMEKWPQCFGRAIIEGLPEDAEIEDVRWNDERRCFGAVVYSASYPIVPDGEMTPIGGGGYLNMRYGWFNRQADGSYRSTDDKQQAFSDCAKLTRAEYLNAGKALPSSVSLNDYKPPPGQPSGLSVDEFLYRQLVNEQRIYWARAAEEIKRGATLIETRGSAWDMRNNGPEEEPRYVALQNASKGDLLHVHFLSPYENKADPVPAETAETEADFFKRSILAE